MISEIAQFIESQDEEVFNLNVKPSQGLHILVYLNDEGSVQQIQSRLIKAKTELDDIAYQCGRIEQHVPVTSTNKALDLAGGKGASKKIHSANVYALRFKKKIEPYTVKKAFPHFFEKAFSFLPDKAADVERSQLELWAKQFKSFCEGPFWEYLSKGEGKEYYDAMGDKYINVYLANPGEAVFQKVHEQFLKQTLFNKDEYNRKLPDGTLVGVSDFLNGLNTKKPFLQKQTGGYGVVGMISEKTAKRLHEFEVLQRRGLFPNPLPIFIDREHVNRRIPTFIQENQEQGWSRTELLQEFFRLHEKELFNFYLIYFASGEITDIDYISQFRYEFKHLDKPDTSWQIGEILQEGKEPKGTDGINTVFDFEKKVVPHLFNSAVVGHKGSFRRYFEEIKIGQFVTRAHFTNAMHYRKAVYDFIYKSRFHSINAPMFYTLLMTGIKEDIRLDDGEYFYRVAGNIKHKLNILLSLNEFFDPEHTNFYGVNMKDEIDNYRSTMDRLMSDPDAEFGSDEAYAYCAGQVIHFLLTQSAAANKSHAMLEPFLQKVNTEQFKKRLVDLLKRYGHEISMYHGKVNNLVSRLTAAEPDRPVYELEVPLISGFTDKNRIYMKNQKAEEHS